MHPKLTQVSLLPSCPQQPSSVRWSRNESWDCLRGQGNGATHSTQEPSLIYVSKGSQIGMWTGHIVFLLEQCVIKAIFLQLEKKWEKIKSQRLQMGEKYLVRKSCDSPLSSITVHMEELQMPIENHSYCRKRVKGSETHALVQFALECLLCGRHNGWGTTSAHSWTFMAHPKPLWHLLRRMIKIGFYLEKSTLRAGYRRNFSGELFSRSPDGRLWLLREWLDLRGELEAKAGDWLAQQNSAGDPMAGWRERHPGGARLLMWPLG